MTMDQLDTTQRVDPVAIATALAPWLDDLEARLDPVDEQRLLDEWKAFAGRRLASGVFQPRRAAPAPPRVSWPSPSIAEAVADPQAMVLRQLRQCSDRLARGDGGLLCARAEYGTGTLPAVFGVPVVKMESETLPGTLPLGRAAMPALVERGPDYRAGVWRLTLEVGRAFVACTRGRPGLERHMHIYHPDLQGPMDLLELVWGSECFTAFVEEPELTHAVLRAMTEAYVEALRQWDAAVPDRDPGWCAHWGLLHRGHIMLREDSAMNLSPRMFTQLCAPYDSELLARCGGGAIHACGRVAHFLPLATALPAMHGFNFGQPEMNAPQAIARGTIAVGTPIVGLRPERWTALEQAGIDPRGLVHLW